MFLLLSTYFLTELKEQLIARSSRVDDIERLKTEFNDQKREIKEQNEAELEGLRRYESHIYWCIRSHRSLHCLSMFDPFTVLYLHPSLGTLSSD